MNDTTDKYPPNFIRSIIEKDVTAGKNEGAVMTRFPPEPNGYLHIGHAKAICLSFGMAKEFGGKTNLRFDDTNPLKESVEFKESMKRDIEWLGFEWHEERNASDYFEELYRFAEQLITAGKAYVDSLSAEEIREYRGTLREPGKNSPHRDRTADENLDLFRRMRAGEFGDGEHVLRLKIDMGSPNINMRDPTIYRIRHVHHHQTGDEWCIYPMYDYTHCISDSLEGITHSLCDLSFEDHRPLYDWVLDELAMNCHPQQIEFSRLNLQYTVMSKRKLKQLVEANLVDGWDDPRMPTIAGLRRRGYTPGSIRDFCRRIGVTKSDNNVELVLLESVIREHLDTEAPRAMGVINPLKIVIDNYPEDQVEPLSAGNHPKDDSMGTRTVPFTRELYIDREDFREEANRKYKRLVSGGEVRLRSAYVIKAEEVIKDDSGEILELRCTYDPDTLGKNPEGRKVRGVIHWVSASEGLPAEIRLFEPLFTEDFPDASEREYTELINPTSMTKRYGFVEPSLRDAPSDARYQFEREGYFCLDSKDSKPDALVFNRVVGLRDTWAKIEQKGIMSRINLKYGVNPHQANAQVSNLHEPLQVLNGNPGYINLLDAFTAWQLVIEMQAATGKAAAASFKHVSPAGAAVDGALSDEFLASQFLPSRDYSPVARAYARARGGDRMCSFGDAVAVSETVDESLADLLKAEVSDLIIAPDFEPAALETLKQKKGGNFLLLKMDPAYRPPSVEKRELFGFTFEQDRNDAEITAELFGGVSDEIRETLIVTTLALKYAQSNSVCVGYQGQVIGLGAGQQSRIHCTRLACDKAEKWLMQMHPDVLRLPFKSGLKKPDKANVVDQYLLWGELSDAEREDLKSRLDGHVEPISAESRREWIAKFDGLCLSSDAYIPFRDNIDRAAKTGIQVIAHPGGSVRDESVKAACEQYRIQLLETGIRCFLH